MNEQTVASSGLSIAASGLVTAVGGCSEQTLSSVNAGISGYRLSRFMNTQGYEITAARVDDYHLPELHESVEIDPKTRTARCLQLAEIAFKELESKCTIDQHLSLMMALPEDYPDMEPLADDFTTLLSKQVDYVFNPDKSAEFSYGRAAGIAALHGAIALFEDSSVSQVLIGGVDCLSLDACLRSLDSNERALATARMDAFAPGEAAVFLLLERNHQKSSYLHEFATPGFAQEPGHRYSEEIFRGDGLSSAIQQALQDLGDQKIRSVYCTLNGENLSAKEWGVAALRCNENLDDNLHMVHPADCFGDIGAAFGPVLLALASQSVEQGQIPSPALVWSSADAAFRSAVVINDVSNRS